MASSNVRPMSVHFSSCAAHTACSITTPLACQGAWLGCLLAYSSNPDSVGSLSGARQEHNICDHQLFVESRSYCGCDWCHCACCRSEPTDTLYQQSLPIYHHVVACGRHNRDLRDHLRYESVPGR